MVMARIREIFTRYPLLRGMVSYSILWPTSAFIQQKIAGKSWSEIDWEKCARFSFYGGLYVAPTLYTWIRVSSKLFPHANLRSAICKVSKSVSQRHLLLIRFEIKCKRSTELRNGCSFAVGFSTYSRAQPPH